MDILINRTVEEFIRATYGEGLIGTIVEELGSADDQHLEGRVHGMRMLDRAARRLSKPTVEMLEDLGAWMTRIEAIRRLLRFSGRDFTDFLDRLDEMPGRTHLVLPGLNLPAIQIEQAGQSRFLTMTPPDPAWRHLMIGMVRGMADDYGALCLIATECGVIRVDIWDTSFAEGRDFTLGGPDAGVVQ
ncbi:heme NO-binding domain-containing protein [Paracoccus sp. 1_MG-2023]|uniref:heme NO-binding domain-containing protein n=1 Tax=unclassified Paracoccus (in: a-proteobacteria) TaxID=2688777 RepID=UPI001C08C70E|nr:MULTISPECIES: heme NO-binding domain-containing protein [unclassified Paracoccus (in: a-proteobacteria)]MBU2956764.1 heme NO-binding domain-containing protein [Paracoccus sp. C2R09]MDO6669197.1 heme NO-binding domain-containing protein [Paracoccus sp. 1_MG-2023]